MPVITPPVIRVERHDMPLTIQLDERSRRRLSELCRMWNMPPEEAAAELLAQKLREISGTKR